MVKTKPVKPMLAVEADLKDIQYPCYVSVKLDGIRCLIVDGVAMSRSGKPIRNKHVQYLFGREEYNGMDGELVVGNIFAEDVFQKTTSAVMSFDGEPDVVFHVFDNYLVDKIYSRRYNSMMMYNIPDYNTNVKLIDRNTCENESELLQHLNWVADKGGEGIIVRNPLSPYKHGRSTKKEGGMLKIKFFEDDEFEVVGFEEQMTNTNVAELDELGYTKRSSAKGGMVGKDTLGSIILKYGDSTFKCGTGFNDSQRHDIWNNQDKYLGKLAKIQYMTAGMKDLPRVPSFKGWRDIDDL